ncbi:MAG TPA: hypothetical protein VK689_12225, partial [Armatimonadota bacterium]|nr:hypothetical protein [Armatimonadota bacterium]
MNNLAFFWRIGLLAALAVLAMPGAIERPAASAAPRGPVSVSVCAAATNDLYRVLRQSRLPVRRYDSPEAALAAARPGAALLVLADGYPDRPTRIPPGFYERAAAKQLRLYVEFAEQFPGGKAGDPQPTEWERLVVTTDRFVAKLPRGRILALPDCRFIPAEPPRESETWVAIARVAGFDQAVYGVPPRAFPLLYRSPDSETLVATTRLSGMISGRYAPHREWTELWSRILGWLRRTETPVSWNPLVRPAFGPATRLPRDAERRALQTGVDWYHRSGLMLTPDRVAAVHALLRQNRETLPRPASDVPGAGSLGILEGYASGIRHDGSQMLRLPLRADCQAESAMVLASAWAVADDERSRKVASNLLEYLYRSSGMQGGIHGDPRHPAFGLIAWGSVSPQWEVASYGDDAARTLLATALAATWLGTDAWDRPLVRGLLAHLRTTGRQGFRGDRIDFPDLQRRGWRAYQDADTVNLSPHFEAYLWACNLWAYRTTGDREFLERTRIGIRKTMEAYPSGWRWRDNLDRARMLLPLAWLVRVEDTAEHRRWLTRVAEDLLKQQQPNGALAEQVNERGGGGHLQVPTSNESYGTGETPLIQRNGDPVSDQLYTTGFALLGLHEAAAATGDHGLRRAG